MIQTALLIIILCLVVYAVSVTAVCHALLEEADIWERQAMRLQDELDNHSVSQVDL